MKAHGLSCVVASLSLLWIPRSDAQSGEGLVLPDQQVIVIKGDATRKKVGRVELEAYDAEAVPGNQGDALKALAYVAGVVRPPVGGARGLSVWGAAPADTRIYVDDIPLPRLFHFGGTRSVLPSAEISSFSLISGGAGARYGRGIGGAIIVKTADPVELPMVMGVRIDPLDVGGRLEARIGEQGSFSFASRSSVLSSAFDSIAPSGAEKLVVIPDYWDYQSRFSYRLDDGRQLQILGLLSGDELKRSIPSMIAGDEFSERSSAGFGRLGVRLSSDGERDASRMSLWVGHESEQSRLDYGDVLAENRTTKDSIGLLLVREKQLRPGVGVRIGLDSEVSRSHWVRNGAVTLPAREGDIGAFGQAPGNRINQDTWTVTQASAGVFASAILGWRDTLEFTPGVRMEPSIVNGQRVLPVRPSEPQVGYTELEWALNPRARLVYHPRPSTAVYTAVGRYTQTANSGDLSPVFGSPVLKQARAWQALVGADLQALPWLDLGGQVFVARQFDLVVRSQSPTPAIASLLEARGQGRVVGAQISASATPRGPVRASASYTLMRAERLDSGGSWRRFDQDVTHTLRSVVQWTPGTRLSFGARLEVTSGMPRTPVADAIFNVSSQRFDPVFGSHNSERLPAFAELSLRATYQRSGQWGQARLWLDVVNATNRENAQEVFYSANFEKKGYLRGLPVLPLLGAELRI